MPDSDAGDAVAAMNAKLEQVIPPVWTMGVRFTELRPGFARATVPFEGNGNHFGVMYAGVIFTVAEILGGGLHSVTFDESTHYPLVRNLEIDFVAPGRTELTATATLSDAEIERVRAESADGGKSPFVLEAEVVDSGGTVVATTRGDYQSRAIGR